MESIWLTVRLMGGQLRQSIGYFGWLDLPAPTWVLVLWVLAVVVLIVCALLTSSRVRRALPLLAVAIFVCPFLFETPLINTAGPGWQGRYWLPLAMGLSLVAATVVDLRRWALAGGALLAVTQLGAFVSTLDAYDGRPVRPGTSASWHPPGGAPLTIALFVVGQVLLVGFVWANRQDESEVRLKLKGVVSATGRHRG